MHVAVIGRKLILFLPLSDHFFFILTLQLVLLMNNPESSKLIFSNIH